MFRCSGLNSVLQFLWFTCHHVGDVVFIALSPSYNQEHFPDFQMRKHTDCPESQDPRRTKKHEKARPHDMLKARSFKLPTRDR